MLNLQIVIGDNDLKYVQKLSAYLMNFKNHHFSVKTFSDPMNLTNYLTNNPLDILLTTENLYAQLKDISHLTILLVDHAVGTGVKLLPTIEKYQSGEIIVQQLLKHYTTYSTREITGARGNQHTSLMGIYSPAGGSGKTTIALALSKHLALQGKSVLFISLEEVTSYDRLLGASRETSLSDLLYHASKRTDNLIMKLEGIQRRDKESGLYFIPPPIYAEDLIAYGDEDWNYLLDYLLQNAQYEFIIVDFTSAISKRNFNLMTRCRKLILLTNLSYVQNAKAEAFMSMMQEEVRHRSLLVANLTKPILEEDRAEIGGVQVNLTIPFSENLYGSKGIKVDLNLDNTFGQSIKKLEEVALND